ncbi:MAG TPA: type II toxin-antitoxin system RelE/ParE family toxin [Vicinamibacterales bacterium]|nr:type II toxin-antitoxin system RelE/ParE family toxin [Vicinamibacterales bacterium]
MAQWEVEFTDEFGTWWDGLTADEQESVAFSVGLLGDNGPMLEHPHSSGIAISKHSHMRELRVQHQGRPYRVLYAFDPRRAAILLIGGEKTGSGNRWYEEFVPVADRIYDAHLAALKADGGIDKRGGGSSGS